MLVSGLVAAFVCCFSLFFFFSSRRRHTRWRPYGDISHDDKSLAWSQDGSTLFTTSLREVSSGNAEINTYSGTISGSDFGSPINTYNPSRDLDQPWIRTGPSDHVYVAYNDITSAGDTARVLVSSNGGVDYTSAGSTKTPPAPRSATTRTSMSFAPTTAGPTGSMRWARAGSASRSPRRSAGTPTRRMAR